MRGNGYGAKKKDRTKNEENQTWNKETKEIIPDHKYASSGSELEKREMISKAASLKDRGQKAGGEKYLQVINLVVFSALCWTRRLIMCLVPPSEGAVKQQHIWKKKNLEHTKMF